LIFRQFHKQFRVFRQTFPNDLFFPFIQTKLAIYSYFWANYSISLQKSLLSDIGLLPVGYMIRL